VRDPWEEAQTAEELGDCYARWFERTLPYQRTVICTDYGDVTPVGNEAAIIAWLCRTGNFIVHHSTIGMPQTLRYCEESGEYVYETKAYASAFVSPGFIDRVREMLQGQPNLYFAAYGPGQPEGRRFGTYAISNAGGIEGVGDTLCDIRDQYRHFHPDAIQLLLSMWRVFVAETEWGCNAHLWPAIATLI
jgi:hypothetical protein